MTSGAQTGEGWFVEVSQGFQGVLLGSRALWTLRWTTITPSFKAKTECIPLCVPESSFTYKVTNSEINSITSVYYIKSYYIAYYKIKRSNRQNKAPHHRQMTGGPHA
jgi:hypothetical protein